MHNYFLAIAEEALNMLEILNRILECCACPLEIALSWLINEYINLKNARLP